MRDKKQNHRKRERKKHGQKKRKGHTHEYREIKREKERKTYRNIIAEKSTKIKSELKEKHVTNLTNRNRFIFLDFTSAQL